ncbi:hypothetical protein C2S51_000447 [Perilla frutescens var. frutescens]|nr:hypothetical protein C2S51_000447 [Perilla frutescens var. frutescens]
MVTREESRAAQLLIIVLLIVYLHPVASQRSDDDDEATAEASPFPPLSPPLPYSSLNSCPNNRLLQLLDAITCKPSSVEAAPPPADDGVDLHPVSDMMGDGEVSTAKLTEAVVLAFLTSRKDEGTQWEILVILVVFPSAVWALFFCEIPLRNMHPRFANVIGIIFVNGVMAFHLPKDYYWVPAVCLGSSLLTLVIASCLL